MRIQLPAFAVLLLLVSALSVSADDKATPDASAIIDLTNGQAAPHNFVSPRWVELSRGIIMFPRIASSAKASATLVINAQGKASDVKIVESSGRDTFDSAFVLSLAQGYFVPGMVDGKTVTVRVRAYASADSMFGGVTESLIIVDADKQDCLSGDPERRVSGCTAMIAKGNDYNLPRLLRGYAYEVLGRFDEAMADFDTAEKMNPFSGDAVRMRGIVYDKQGQYARAIESYTDATDRRDSAAAIMDRGLVYDLTGKPDRAAADYKEAASMAPNCGNCHKSLDAAIAPLDQRIAANPNDLAAFASRCMQRALAGRQLSMALADCNHVLDRVPEDANVLEARGLTFLRMASYGDAIEDFDAALAREPKRSASLYFRGLAKLRMGDTAGAHSDIIAARDIDPSIAMNMAFSGVLPR